MTKQQFSRLCDLQAIDAIDPIPLSMGEFAEMIYLELLERLVLPHSFNHQTDWLDLGGEL